MSVETDPALLPRSTAVGRGLARYFTGEPCQRAGHIAERYTRNKNCVECDRARKADTYAVNPEKCIQRVSNWQRQNPVKVNAKNSAWQRRNPVSKNLSVIRYRLRKSNAQPPWLSDSQKKAIREIYEIAAKAGLTVDHVVPLRGDNVCGLHVPWNLQQLGHAENASKGNRHVS